MEVFITQNTGSPADRRNGLTSGEHSAAHSTTGAASSTVDGRGGATGKRRREEETDSDAEMSDAELQVCVMQCYVST